MRKYQLIGRKKLFSKTKIVDYPPLHILSLPYEVLIEIISYLERDIKALLALTRTCSRLRTIVNKFFLYRDVVFSATRFRKFVGYHLPGHNSSLTKKLGLNDSSTQINLIQLIKFIKPPMEKSENYSTNIGGSYNVESVHARLNRDMYSEFVSGLRYLLKEDFGLKAVEISEVSPGFEFPQDVYITPRSTTLSWKKSKPTRTLQHLKISAQNGWSIPFSFSQVSLFFSVFDIIEELELTNFIIDKEKLCSSTVPQVQINKITLNACTYTTQKQVHSKTNFSPMFGNCSSLALRDIHLVLDLSVIDFIKNNHQLSSLTLDIDSPVFYSAVNDERKFNFARYNLFFKLLCSGEGGYASLKKLELENFDLINDCSHAAVDPSQDDDWVPAPTDNFETFLQYVSAIPKLVINLKKERKVGNVCVRCGYSKENTPETPSAQNANGEWRRIISKLNNGSNEVTVRDSNGSRLFQAS